MPSTISVVVITKNEEANIRRCLESVRWADEVVAVDSGSTDATLDICREYGCRMLSHEWEGYARQKNFAVRQAGCDWILSLDADEEITPELARELRPAVESGSAQAYSIPRRNMFLGRAMGHGGWYPDRQLRLWRNGLAEFKTVPLHEHLDLPPGTPVGRLKTPFIHYTYPTLSDFLRKSDAYTSIEAQTILKEGRLPRSLILAMVTAFPVKFAEVYLYKGGWRDGLHGFIAAALMSARVFTRWAKVWDLLRNSQE